jgi:LysM repeat protein
MILLMKLAIWISAVAALAFGLTSCGSSGGSSADSGQRAGIGPFDSQGRYRDEWADNPSMWRKPGSTSAPKSNDDIPKVAQNEQPPMNSVPLASAPVPKSTIAETKKKVSKSSEVVVKSRRITKAEAETARSNTKAHSKSKSKSKSKLKSERDSEPEPEVVKKKSNSKSTAKSESKTKEKTKTKERAKTSHYVVKSGDSLSKIASRHGCSVSAIQKANGISGSVIRPGQSLSIPK